MALPFIIVSFIFIILYLITVIINNRYNYWKLKNVPYIKPWPILGNYGKHIILQEYIGEVVKNMCLQLPGAPYFGAFLGTEPVLVVKSPNLLKLIMTKDFYYFNGREISKYATKEMITKNVFFVGNERWKISRQLISPLFSSAKMRNMFKLIEKCSYMFEDMLDCELRPNDVIEVKDLSGRFTMDCIMSCAFGIESNTIHLPNNNLYCRMSHEIFKQSFYKELKFAFRSIWPFIFYGLRFKCFPSTIEAFFSTLLKTSFEIRNHIPIGRNDFVDLLLSVKQQDNNSGDSVTNTRTGLDDKIHLKVDDESLTALCLAVFGAGFETSASTISFTLYELAKHQDVQQRAVEEVDEFLRRHNNKLDYECINELPYLEACIYEALRKYPVLSNLTREVMDDYIFPDGLHLNKGARIHIPIYYMHHNPEYFPDPEIYNPDRFLPENKNAIKPYTFFPYGEGPRICVGKRFARMQMLPGLLTFLKRYRVELAPGMPETLILGTSTFVTVTKRQGIFLKISERKEWNQRTFHRS